MFDIIRITHTDGTVTDAPGRKSDVVRFERHFRLPVSRLFDDGGMFTEHLWYFGYLAESRVIAEQVEFDDWMDTVDQVEIVTVEDTAPPSHPSSSPSA